jgi:hypothetical protein
VECGKKHDPDDYLDKLIHIFSSIHSSGTFGGPWCHIAVKDARLVREFLLELKALRGELPLYRSVVRAITEAKFPNASGAGALITALRSELHKSKIGVRTASCGTGVCHLDSVAKIDNEGRFRIKFEVVATRHQR